MKILFFEYVAKFILGGSIIVLVSHFAKRGNPILAGILLAAPIITMISSIIVGNESGPRVLMDAILNDMIFLPLMFVYLFPLYLLLKKSALNINLSIIIAWILWLAASFTLFKLKG